MFPQGPLLAQSTYRIRHGNSSCALHTRRFGQRTPVSESRKVVDLNALGYGSADPQPSISCFALSLRGLARFTLLPRENAPVGSLEPRGSSGSEIFRIDRSLKFWIIG